MLGVTCADNVAETRSNMLIANSLSPPLLNQVPD
jgi:hypothetical protein